MNVPSHVSWPQLTSDNFNNWRFRISALQEEKQIKVALEKSVADYQQEKEKNEFLLNDAKAKSVIVQSVTDKHLDLIKDAKTAKEMMKALEDVFQRKSVFSKLTLKKKLLTLKLRKNEKLEDHFLNFDTVIRELDNVDCKVEETDKVCHFLLSLNDNYDSVITAIVTLNTDVTMDFVKSRLLDEELKIKNKNSNKSNFGEDTAFKTYQPTCFRCGQEGHKIAECEKQFVNRGRFIRGARWRGAQRYRGRGGRGTFAKANKANESNVSCIALNCMLSLNNKKSFILDSGATQNLVNCELEKFMIDVELLQNEIFICVANGQNNVARKKGILQGFCQSRQVNINV